MSIAQVHALSFIHSQITKCVQNLISQNLYQFCFSCKTTMKEFVRVHAHAHIIQILVRVHEQFELFVSEDQPCVDHQLLMGVLKTIAKIGPRADPVFRDECESELFLSCQYNNF